MRDLTKFDELSRSLEEACRERNGIVGLVLLGSTAEASRRDQWSDHDFFVLIEPGHESQTRSGLDWLPQQDRVVLTAREGEIGFVAVYDDGHVLEFALASTAELDGALIDTARIVYDDGAVAPLVTASRARAAAADQLWLTSDTAAANDARLVLVKLLIGVGRTRRGERLVGGQFVRTWAVNHLVRAVRAREPIPASSRDTIDPLRRFELDYPELGNHIAAALDRATEDAARDLFTLTRDALETGWDRFPSQAADAIARRLGWRTESRI